MNRAIDLERLRGIELFGRILYTDAIDIPENPRGLDQVLMRAGFSYWGNVGQTVYMRSPDNVASVRYHPADMDHLAFGEEGWDSRIRTRMDFVSRLERDDVAHTVAKALLEAGYLIFVPGDYFSVTEYGDELLEVRNMSPPAAL